MYRVDIELQKESIKQLQKDIESLQAFKENIETRLDKLKTYKLLLQVTKKEPELLARIEGCINEGVQHHAQLTEKIKNRKNLYQTMQFFEQATHPRQADRAGSPLNPGPSSSGQESEMIITDTPTLK